MNSEIAVQHVDALTQRRRALVVRGIAAILFGILAIVLPLPSLVALVYIFGIYGVLAGIFNLVLAVRRGKAGLRWGWFLFEGLVSIAAGVIAFVWPGITMLILYVLIAIWAVVRGIGEVASAIALRRQIQDEWLLV